MNRIDLAHDQRLLLRDDGRELHFEAADGSATLRITVTAAGPVHELTGDGLKVRAAGDLELEGDAVRVHGRRSLQLSSGGDANVTAAGAMRSSGCTQELRAELGDVRVRANDDVRVNGERILMNL
ncbi:MAG: hypothetical protein PF961_06475 [Planctomycetota bacterium]|jgi:hypothetical protein|nr:hypothetical protein [Planctomycetota bacterium]